MQQSRTLGETPFAEVPYRVALEAMLMQATMACDGTIPPERHAQLATQAAAALIARQESRS